VELVGFFVDNNGVAGIGTTLVSHYYVSFMGQKVGYFGLTLISKLCSDDNYVSQGFIFSRN
jgi:hypothetical protein